ncbi:hypothetical protein GE09DRAFT_1113837 [Coniochaeta sp. 2T2.1]|nr:hypothetical protein GE09DRAFT_1113837 [Coniochaeta sp. 2T2.1]
MTGRARNTRGGPRAEGPSSATMSMSPPRRTTRRTPTAEEEAVMPPPPPPGARAGRITRGQSKEADPARPPPSRFAALSLAGSEQIIQEEEAESQSAEDAAVAEQLRDSQSAMAASESLGALAHFSDGASDYRDTQSQSQYSRGFVASTPARSEIQDNTPGGRRARAKVLVRLMPHLSRYASDVQQELYNYDETDETWQLTYEQLYGLFLDMRYRFQSDGFFLSDAYVIARLDRDPDTPAAFQASKTVALANITSLLVSIHDAAQSGWNAGDLLPSTQAWDEAFPSKFLPRREPNERPWMEEGVIIDLALQLRIQRTIYTLEEIDAEPLSLLDAIWIDPRGLSPREKLLAFLTGDDDGGAIELKRTLAGVSLNDERYTELRKNYIDQVRQLYAAAARADLATAIAELKEEYPIEPLVKNVQNWSRQLFEQIHREVDHTRASTIHQDSQSVITSQIGDSQADSQVDPRMFAPPEARPAAYAGAELADLQQLRDLEAQAGPSQQSPGLVQLSSQHQPSPSPSVLGRNKAELFQARIESHPSSVYNPFSSNPYNAQSTQSGRQPEAGMHYAQSAARATDSPYQPPPSTMTSNAYGKRPAETQDSDDPFETDVRQSNSQRRVEVAEMHIAETPPRPRKRARQSKAAMAAATAGTPGTEGEQTPRRPPAPGADDPDLDLVAQKARQVTIEHRKPKAPQTRSPWSRADEKTLIKAVEVYDAKWSSIEKAAKTGTIVFERDVNQQALRDKARLLKVDFLKADRVLPPNFDLVVLGKKEKDIVIACGKNPNRGEQDYDDANNVTNTGAPVDPA